MARRGPTYDTDRLLLDCALRSWNPSALAKAAKLSTSQVSRFLSGEVQTAKTAQKLAKALGYEPKRYLLGIRARKAS